MYGIIEIYDKTRMEGLKLLVTSFDVIYSLSMTA